MEAQQFAHPVRQQPVEHPPQVMAEQQRDPLQPEAPQEPQRAVAEAHPLRIDRFIQGQAALPVHRAVHPIQELLIQPAAPEALLQPTADPAAAVHLPMEEQVVVLLTADPAVAAVVHHIAGPAVAAVALPIAGPAAVHQAVALPIADQVAQALLIAADILLADHLPVHVLQVAAVQARAEDNVPITILT